MAKKTKYVTDSELQAGLKELFDYDLAGIGATSLLVSEAGKDELAFVTFVMTRPTRDEYDKAKAMQAELNKLMQEAFKETDESAKEVPELATK